MGLAVLAVMTAATTAVAVTAETGYINDKFDTAGSFSGSNGTLDWNGPWYELGESDGGFAGSVHVDPEGQCSGGGCLHLYGQGQSLAGVGVKRYADLSVFENVELCFEAVYAGETGSAILTVLVTADQGSWSEVARISATPGYQKGIVPVGDWATGGFGVKFVVDGALNGEFFVDNVEIKGSLTPVSTTTSTTKPSTTTSTTKPSTTTSTSKPSTTTSTTDDEYPPGDDYDERETPTTTEPTHVTTTRPQAPATSDTDSVMTERPVTTTSEATTTTTTETEGDDSQRPGFVVASGPPPGSGLRDAAAGVQADYTSGMYGPMDMGDSPQVLGVEFDARYSMAVEVIRSSWVWIIALAVIITAAIVSGIDRRRSRDIERAPA